MHVTREVEIRAVDSWEELERCAYLQRVVWGFADPDIVTPEMLAACRARGGIVLGAFPPQLPMIGFAFSFPAPLGPKVIQHSHMLAVLKEFQDRGVGTQLKWAQYQEAERLKIDRITWTFDPLESRNAHLNLNKLGAVVRRYYVNLYGESTSSRLHAGLGTDRFLAEWTIGRLPKRLSGRVSLEQALKLPPAILTQRGRQGLLRPRDLVLRRRGPALSVEIPFDIQSLKGRDPKLAREWRLATRQVFSHYLERRYQVVGLMVVPPRSGWPARSFCRLQLVC